MNVTKKIRPTICLMMMLGAPAMLPSFSTSAHAADHPFAEAHFAKDTLTTARKLLSTEDYKAAHDNLIEARKHLNLADKSDHRKAALDQIDNAVDACEHKRPAIAIEHIDKANAEIDLMMK